MLFIARIFLQFKEEFKTKLIECNVYFEIHIGMPIREGRTIGTVLIII